MSKRIAVLGSTGSVGVQALQIIAEHPDHFDVVLLAANRSKAALLDQAREFQPDATCLVAGAERDPLLRQSIGWFTGPDGLLEALEHAKPDVVLNAITGAAGLPASEWTLRRGLTLALANKESFVVAGAYLTDLARDTGATILPVDSEHCAIFQCMQGQSRQAVRRVYLTASGGPFRKRDLSTFAAITPQEALRHPTWDMGPRITIGSATMMNKAFEVIEAHWLFGLEAEQIRVLIHPQSIVHSMVEFVDGTILAHLGVPDMRVPILYALGWPERLPFPGYEPFDPIRFSELQFATVDDARFPAVPLAYETLDRGGDAGAVLNAADEVMTESFLAGKVPFPSIVATVADVLRERPPEPVHGLSDVTAADRAARESATSRIETAKTGS